MDFCDALRELNSQENRIKDNSQQNKKIHLPLSKWNIYIYVLTLTNPPSARIVQNPGQIIPFLGNSYALW
jgi:hypothetical protein